MAFRNFAIFGTVCLVFCASTLARPQVYIGNAVAPAPYEFAYKVENAPTNTFFGQNEVGDAAGGKAGSYYVLLPDGKYMTVDYTADAQGYFPKISYQTGARPSLG